MRPPPGSIDVPWRVGPVLPMRNGDSSAPHFPASAATSAAGSARL